MHVLDYQLLSPEEESDEIYPYRRVWRPLLIEMGIYALITAMLLVLTTFNILADTHDARVQVILGLLPALTFLWFSVRPEYRVFEPRPYLIPLFVLGVILANGFVVPIVEQVFTPDEWLPAQGFFNRILGYMLTTGVLTVFVHYAVVRYTVWPTFFRTRLDGIAYTMTIAVAFAVVLNIRFALIDEPTLSASAIRMLTNYYLNIMVAVIVGYFLGEMAIGTPAFYRFPASIVAASFVYGLYTAFRGIAVRSGLNVGATSNRAIGPYFLAIGFSLFIIWLISFLIESADERMASREGLQRIR